MTNYLIRRFVQMMFVVLLATVAIYALLNIAPGGPLDGLRMATDAKARVSEADIARLEAYLGLDKPIFLRYIAWMIGDDWMGADWVYVGLKQFQRERLGKDGNPLFDTDARTGEKIIMMDKARFWTDPGLATLNPGYELWVWGTSISDTVIDAESIRVKPPLTEDPPDDILKRVYVISSVGSEINVEDLNGEQYTLLVDRETEYEFPLGEGTPLPDEGKWIDVSWLFGFDGLLGKYAGFHGEGQGILRLDFGFSWKLSPGQPVSGILESRVFNTIKLMATASIISLIIAIPIGIYSAVNQYSKVDYAATTFAFFGSAMPVFWFGLMLILIFSYQFKKWGLLFMPSGGIQLVREAPAGSLLAALNTTPGTFIDKLVHILMPAMMLSLLYMAGWSRYMRSSMLEVLRQDYVRTARAKGLIERVVIIKHALRNALIPIITIVVFQLPALFGGATLTETVFSYPGIGRLYFDALGGSDWPIVMAILFINAVLVVIATLMGDFLYTIVDPRIRF